MSEVETPEVEAPEQPQTPVDSSTAPETPETSPETPPKEGENASETPPLEGKSGENEPPPFQPNTTFKVYDEEHQIPERFHALMTDAESEKEIRELYEKAFGLDKVKPKYQEVRKKYEEMAPLAETWGKLNEAYNNKDYENFFKGLGVTDEAVFEYAQKLLAYDELTAEQKAEYDRVVAERSELSTLRQEVNSLRDAQTNYSAQVRGQELDTELARPEVAQIVEKYDSVYGQGAFRNLAIDTGESAWKTQQVDYGARDVVAHLARQYAPFIAAPQAQASVAQAAQGQPMVVPPKKETIPNIQGQSTSPMRQEVKSIDDLKKIRESMGASTQQKDVYQGTR